MRDVVIFNKGQIENFNNKSKIKMLQKYLFKKKKILIFKKFLPNFADKIIEEAKKRTKKKPRFFRPNFNCSDLYIFNKNLKKSKVRGYYRKVLLFPWNKKNYIYFKKTKELIKFKNNLLENNYKIKNNNNVIQIMNYPIKKGYLSKHKDSNSHKECVIQIAVDKPDKRTNGGLVVFKNKKNINIDGLSEKGDLIVFSKGLEHFVRKDLTKSRWSVIIGDIKLN